jgi:predicted GIY-YIG superfamily endonuclease
MPKVAMDYSRTIVYKIVCNDVNIKDLYVGHTTNFVKRKYEHKSNSNNVNSKDYNIYVYQFIRNNGGWNNFSMIEVEKYVCNDRLEAKKRERYWIETLNATLNKVIPSRCKNEYRKDNKSKIQEQSKNYYETNKIKLLEKNQNYYENNKLQISEKRKVKITCDICNCEITKRYLQIHNKTIKHQNNLLMNQQENDNS